MPFCDTSSTCTLNIWVYRVTKLAQKVVPLRIQEPSLDMYTPLSLELSIYDKLKKKKNISTLTKCRAFKIRPYMQTATVCQNTTLLTIPCTCPQHIYTG